MQLAAEALQEADKWSTLSADIEETFKTQVKNKEMATSLFSIFIHLFCLSCRRMVMNLRLCFMYDDSISNYIDFNS